MPIVIRARAVIAVVAVGLLLGSLSLSARADDPPPRVTTEGARTVPSDLADLPADVPGARYTRPDGQAGGSDQAPIVRCSRQTWTQTAFLADASTGHPSTTVASTSSWVSPESCDMPNGGGPGYGFPPASFNAPSEGLSTGYWLTAVLTEERVCLQSDDGHAVDMCTATWLPSTELDALTYGAVTVCGGEGGWPVFDQAVWTTGTPSNSNSQGDCTGSGSPTEESHIVGYQNPVTRDPMRIADKISPDCQGYDAFRMQDPAAQVLLCGDHVDRSSYCSSPSPSNDPTADACGEITTGTPPEIGLARQLTNVSVATRYSRDGDVLNAQTYDRCSSCSSSGSAFAYGMDDGMTTSPDDAHGTRDRSNPGYTYPAGNYDFRLLNSVSECVDATSMSPNRAGPRYSDCTAPVPAAPQVSRYTKVAAPPPPPSPSTTTSPTAAAPAPVVSPTGSPATPTPAPSTSPTAAAVPPMPPTTPPVAKAAIPPAAPALSGLPMTGAPLPVIPVALAGALVLLAGLGLLLVARPNARARA